MEKRQELEAFIYALNFHKENIAYHEMQVKNTEKIIKELKKDLGLLTNTYKKCDSEEKEDSAKKHATATNAKDVEKKEEATE